MNNYQENQNRELSFKVATNKINATMEFKFKHTAHSYQRSCQRGLAKNKIIATLEYGEVVHKQGLIYYILGEKNIPDILIKQKQKLQNTIVIVAGDSNQIITCYRSANPFKNIRTKSKELFKNFGNAA